MTETPSGNVSADQLDEETKEKLKGDTIGDTLYSQSFVIKTLMNLSDLKYTEEEEQDLCFLWDMTLEKEVCKLLFDLRYPSLVAAALENCTHARFVEILIGILGNILLADCDQSISEDDIKIVLKEFSTDDSAVLIQLMRFIEGVAYKFPQHIVLLGPELIEQVQFILNYSENSELITQTMQAFIRLTQDFKVDKQYVSGALFKSAIEGFDTIFSLDSNNFEVELDTEETSRVVRTFFNLLSNICAYADKYHHDDSIAETINKSGKLSLIICRILKHMSVEENLFPVTPTFNECVSAITTIVTTRDVVLLQDLENRFFEYSFKPLCEILYLLHSCKSEVLDTFNLVLELIANIVQILSEEEVCVCLGHLKYKKGIVVLNSLKEISRSLDIDISEKLKALFEGFK